MDSRFFILLFLASTLNGFGIGMIVATINIIAGFMAGSQILTAFIAIALSFTMLTWIGLRAVKKKHTL